MLKNFITLLSFLVLKENYPPHKLQHPYEDRKYTSITWPEHLER